MSFDSLEIVAEYTGCPYPRPTGACPSFPDYWRYIYYQTQLKVPPLSIGYMNSELVPNKLVTPFSANWLQTVDMYVFTPFEVSVVHHS
jgi:hypothetical protein